MCMISVIVPIYKTEKTLERCINSILAQSLKDFELVLINDGSPDNSEQICKKFAAEDKRIRYILKENGGLSSVRNLGIEEAKGDYIAFVDSDDYIEPDMLEYMHSIALRDNCEIVMCGYKIENGKTVVDNFCNDMILDCKNINENMVELKSKNLIDCAWNKLYNRDFLIKTGVKMPVGETYEDTAFNLELLKHKPRISVTSKCFYHYVQNMGSITKKYDPKKLETMKKRARMLLEVTEGIEPYCGFFYVKSVFSSIIDMFLSCGRAEIMNIIACEINDSEFKKAAEVAEFGGALNSQIIKAARSGSAKSVYRFCKLSYLLKYKMNKLFMRVKS